MRKTTTLKSIVSVLILLIVITASVFLLAGCSDDPPVQSSPSQTDPPSTSQSTSQSTPPPVHEHKWVDATCTTPITCSECQATAGSSLGHHFLDATCTSPRKCVDCDATEGDALGHSWVDATCAAPKTCKICKETVGDTLEHIVVIDPAIEPTCTTAGITEGKHCFSCNEVIVAQEYIAMLPHVEEVIVGKAPTCTESGLTDGKACTVCGNITVEQKEIPATHTEETIPGKLPSCTEVGITDGVKCSVCGEILVAQEEIEKIEHTEEILEARPPSCNEVGLTEGKKCSVCGEILVAQEEIAKLPHTEEIVNGRQPSCTEVGLTDGKKCSVCGEILVAQEEIAKLAHTEEIVAGKLPSCTEDGLTDGKKCSVCGTVTVAQEVIPALGHTEVTDAAIAPTCTETGLTEGKHCSVCNEVLVAQEVVAALGHDEIKHDAQAPTCTEIGWDAYVTCSRCDYTTYAEKSALGHTEVVDKAIAPTCTETGLTEGKHCSVCNEVVVAQETIAALGHDEVKHEAKAPTCTEIGWDAYVTCKRCDYTTYKEKAALGHTLVVDEAIAPTCTETGLTEGKHCSVCNEVVVAQETIAALGHDEIKHEANAPTCTEIGWDAYVTCKRCDYTTYKEKAALGHDEIAHEAKAPTCTEIGWDTYVTCSRCDYTTYAEKSALGHTEVVDKAIAPTCTETGLTEGKHCSVCNEVVVAQETIAALGHDEVKHEAKAPTCTEIGWDAYVTCKRCDYTTYKEKAALGHDEAEAVIENKIDPDCTNAGSYDTVVYCSVCGEEISRVTTTVEALGHTEAEAVIENKVDPDCTKTGSHDEVIYCSVCGEELARKTVTDDALGHDEIEHEAKAPTCVDIGNEAYVTCSRCDYTTYVEIPATGDHVYDEVFDQLDATCTEQGYVIMICDCGAKQTTETDPLDHAWSEVIYNFSADGSTCTAARECTRKDCDEAETATATITSTVKVPATCLDMGTTTYTAFFDEEWANTQTLDVVDIDALDHAFGDATYNFSADGTACTATRECTREDCDEAETATAVITSVVKTPADCENMGTTTYTATFEEDWAATQTLDVVDIDALTHLWGEITYNFANDGSACTATRSCERDDCDVTETATAVITSVVKTPADCVTMGTTTYTATFEEDWAEVQTLDVVDIDALDHDWSDVTYNFAEDGSACTATRSCERDDCDVTETATAVITSVVKTPADCKNMGTTTYTATFEEDWAEIQTLDVVDIPVSEQHTWVDANCTDPKTCSVCGKTEGDPLGHTEETIDAVAPTHYTVGYTEGVKCSVCEKILSGHEEIPMLKFTVSVENVVVADDKSTVTFDIYVTDNPGLMNLQLLMTIDDEVFDTEKDKNGHTKVTRADTDLANNFVFKASGSNTTHSPYKVVLDSTDPTDEDGHLFTVKLLIKDPSAIGSYDIILEIEHANIPVGVETQVKNGTININN